MLIATKFFDWDLNFGSHAFTIQNCLIASFYFMLLVVLGMVPNTLIIPILKLLSASGIYTFFHFHCLLHPPGNYWHML